MEWFWLFLSYGFLGYLLERMFAKVTAAPKQVRGCFLLPPLCPAYGIAMVVFLAVRDWTGASGWRERKRSPSRRQAGIEPVQHVLVHEAFALLI